MNGSYRSSNSSYGDPRYLSSTTAGGVPPTNVLLDGYQNVLDSNGNSRYDSVSYSNFQFLTDLFLEYMFLADLLAFTDQSHFQCEEPTPTRRHRSGRDAFTSGDGNGG